ncbi:hypothetical protein DB41_FQ00020 [Neochlamydia sp. TUME1]|uniref:coiled-coil domain-containing protein n=1 Tax=Neochlamydia sp. TUME1 TaxID=1478174 RepID=UPI00057E6443|nr:hypothetical protein [Neochlamydia sp. TUME1]KIC76542.1 hypothetical protein DB41_FQ00020 [Neochlamydia sp. TUME1]
MTPISTSSAEYKQFKEAFTQYAQYTAAVNNLRIFVEENKESYKAHLQEEAKQIAEKKAALDARMVDISARKEELAAKKGELAAKKGELAARKEQLNTREAELDATLEQLAKTRIDAEIKLAQAEAKIERGRALSKLADVRVFCTALGLPQPQENDVEKINQIASTYFPNGEIGDINGQITLFSMSPIEKFISETGSTTNKLNFTPIRIVHDPKNLVEFLQKPGCRIKFLGFDARIKDTLEQQLDAVCPKEGRTFKIMYVAPKK